MNPTMKKTNTRDEVPVSTVTVGEMMEALAVIKEVAGLIGNEKVLKMVMSELV